MRRCTNCKKALYCVKHSLTVLKYATYTDEILDRMIVVTAENCDDYKSRGRIYDWRKIDE